MKVSEECEDYYSQGMESHKNHVPNHQPDSHSHDLPMILDIFAALGLRSFQGWHSSVSKKNMVHIEVSASHVPSGKRLHNVN